MTNEPGPAASLLDERLEIETPERVAIVYDLAGIGSRFAAGSIDVLILTFVFMALSFLVLLLAHVATPSGEAEVTAFALAVLGAYAALLSVYYVGFEWLWAGQTPGKRSLKLRVLADDGGPASTGAIFVRNIVRVLDAVPLCPLPYAVAGVVMFANRRAKRIGDYAAGTIVVRERSEPLAPPAAPVDAAPGDALDAADLARVRAFVSRAPQLIPASRAAIARRLADEIAGRHGLAYVDAEPFLALLASGRSPQALRESQGPRP